MNAIRAFFNSVKVDPDDFIKIDEKKVEGYIRALDKECSICIQEFGRSDFLAQAILKTSCCDGYFHRSCLAAVKTCPHCYKVLKNPSDWDNFVTTAHKVVMQQLGCNDEAFVRELIEREETEKRAQIQADFELATRLQDQG